MDNCVVCGRFFKRKRNNQVTCLSNVCQRERRLSNMREWKEKNPRYWSEYAGGSLVWQLHRKKEMERWRKGRPQYFQNYRKKLAEKLRRYMREYMKKYRMFKGK